MDSVSFKVRRPHSVVNRKNGFSAMRNTVSQEDDEAALFNHVHLKSPGWFSEFTSIWPGGIII